MAASRQVVFQRSGVTRTCHVGRTVIPALGGVDLELPSGEPAVLLDGSGSGKPTRVNVIGSLDRVGRAARHGGGGSGRKPSRFYSGGSTTGR